MIEVDVLQQLTKNDKGNSRYIMSYGFQLIEIDDDDDDGSRHCDVVV